jgi:hypothetical protein
LRERALILVLAVFILLPQLRVQAGGWAGTHYGWPTIGEGDEPHYLILVNSVIRDGDLDLRNNYDSAQAGSDQAGRQYAGQELDRHVTYWEGNQRGVGVDPSHPEGPQRPAHSPGIAFLLAPFLYPFRNTQAVEHLACFCAGLATVVAMLCFVGLARHFTADSRKVALVAVATFLGTPVWFYSRSFFNEPFILMTAVAAYYWALRRDSFLIAGAFIALGMLMKPPLALLCVPLALLCLRKPRWSARAWCLTRLGVLPVAAVGVTLGLNLHLYGSIVHGPYPFYWGNPLRGAIGILLSERHGLFFWSPVAFAAAVGWPSFWKQRKLEAGVVGGAFLVFFLLVSCWKFWNGGWCFGPRLLVPGIPFLCLGLLGVPELKWVRRIGISLAVAGVLAACGLWVREKPDLAIFVLCLGLLALPFARPRWSNVRAGVLGALVFSCVVEVGLLRSYWAVQDRLATPARLWMSLRGQDPPP